MLKTLLVALLTAQAALSTGLPVTDTPRASSSTDEWELGRRIKVDAPGQIAAIRYYKWPGDPGPHVGHIWDAGGHELAAVDFTNESSDGWQQQALTAPVVLADDAIVTVSVNAVAGAHFAVALDGLASPLAADHYTVLSGAYVKKAGVFPVNTWSHDYFRDVVFTADPVASVTLGALKSWSNGLVTFTAAVTGRERVQFRVDGKIISEKSRDDSFSGSWDSTGASAGTHVLTATSIDAAGNATTTAASITVAGPQPSKLLGLDDLAYLGAFKLPQGAVGTSSFDYSAGALAYNTEHDSLFAVGHVWQQHVAEVKIPTIVDSTNLTDLAVAQVLQPFSDPAEGKLRTVEDDQSQPVSVSGILPYQGNLYFSGSVFYDGNGTQQLSHFFSGLDLKVLGDVKGPFQVGSLGAGFVSGYFGLIPSAWQAPLGGPVLNGNCCLSIISRTSYGPSAFAIDPTQLGTTNPLPAQPLVYYTGDHPLGPYSGDSKLFNITSLVTGVVFPEGTRSVLFFGRQGVGPACYGPGTTDLMLAGTRVSPTDPDYWCFDPTSSGKGGHGYPYASYVWAYDALDLADVKSGKRQPWDVKPYGVWTLDALQGHTILGAAYDPQTGRIFVSQEKGDGDNPLIHVFTLAVPK